MSPPREELAWAAGLFEGEGSIYRHGERQVTLELSSVDADVVKRFCEIVGAGATRERDWSRYASHYQTQTRWRVASRSEVDRILALLLPWFGVRRAQAAREVLARPVALRKTKPRQSPAGDALAPVNAVTTLGTTLTRGGRSCI